MLQPIPELESLATFGLNDLLEWAASRTLSYGIERSVRFQLDVFENRRALFSFSLHGIGRDAVKEVLTVCHAMHAPERLQQSIMRFISAAAFVHFGFECAGTTMIGKCYLELPPPDPQSKATSGRLQFLGFKWSMNDNSVAVVTRYRALFLTDWNAATEIMLANTGNALRPVMQAFMDTVHAHEPSPPSLPTLLEIAEEGSGRRSYDLNVYDRGISLSMIAEPLQAATKILQLKSDIVRDWQQQNADSAIGHIATGLSRDQQSFCTIYYGMQSDR
jgi:hypothetical protein